MKKTLIVLALILAAKLSSSQNFYTETIVFKNRIIALQFLKYLPENGDTVIGLSIFDLEELNNKIVGLIGHKNISELIIKQQDSVIIEYKGIVEKKDKQLSNLELMNKQTKRTWMKIGLGVGFGGISVGLVVGLVLPYALNH